MEQESLSRLLIPQRGASVQRSGATELRQCPTRWLCTIKETLIDHILSEKPPNLWRCSHIHFSINTCVFHLINPSRVNIHSQIHFQLKSECSDKCYFILHTLAHSIPRPIQGTQEPWSLHSACPLLAALRSALSHLQACFGHRYCIQNCHFC